MQVLLCPLPWQPWRLLGVRPLPLPPAWLALAAPREPAPWAPSWPLSLTGILSLMPSLMPVHGTPPDTHDPCICHALRAGSVSNFAHLVLGCLAAPVVLMLDKQQLLF